MIWWFGLMTFTLVWVCQMLMVYFIPAGYPSINLPLIMVVYLGITGQVGLAQTLGFFWGLGSDAAGLSLFGTQGFFLSLLGYLVGLLSKKIDSEKTVSQVTMVIGATIFCGLGCWFFQKVFDQAEVLRPWSLGVVLFQGFFNVLLAPLVFRMSSFWVKMWIQFCGRRGFLD
ncbi:MAG TPA: hypothetical protein PK876_07740 [Elusimicrobiota bacterium]|nr:hypothetical protein [Elusimicrobiota bacterium]